MPLRQGEVAAACPRALAKRVQVSSVFRGYAVFYNVHLAGTRNTPGSKVCTRTLPRQARDRFFSLDDLCSRQTLCAYRYAYAHRRRVFYNIYIYTMHQGAPKQQRKTPLDYVRVHGISAKTRRCLCVNMIECVQTPRIGVKIRDSHETSECFCAPLRHLSQHTMCCGRKDIDFV